MSTAMTVVFESAFSATARSGASLSGSAPSSTSTSTSPAAAACRAAAVSRPAAAGTVDQAEPKPDRTGVERGAPRQQTRGHAHVQGAHDVAAAGGRQEASAGPIGEGRKRGERGRGRFGDGTAADHDGDGPVAKTGVSGIDGVGLDAADLGIGVAGEERLRDEVNLARPGVETGGGDVGEAGGRRRQLDDASTVFDEPRGAAGCTACRGSPWGQPRSARPSRPPHRRRRWWRGAGRAWRAPAGSSFMVASTLSVPSTPLASLVQAYCASLDIRAPPMTAILDGSAALSASAAVRSAVDQLVATSSSPAASGSFRPPPRTSGAVRRSSDWSASNAKRSLSASQPQLTASLSSPWNRSTWSRDDCT